MRAALRNSGCEFLLRWITVNLAPADLKKAGPDYDLTIAVCMLLSSAQIDSLLDGAVFLGELALDGSLRHITGILAMVSVARDQSYTSVFVATVDADEASLVEDIQAYPVSSLRQLIDHVRCELEIDPLDEDGWQTLDDTTAQYEMDLANIRGQEHAKRVLEVAAAGFHNLIFNGPPGSGKTLLARRLPSILPPTLPSNRPWK